MPIKKKIFAEQDNLYDKTKEIKLEIKTQKRPQTIEQDKQYDKTKEIIQETKTQKRPQTVPTETIESMVNKIHESHYP